VQAADLHFRGIALAGALVALFVLGISSATASAERCAFIVHGSEGSGELGNRPAVGSRGFMVNAVNRRPQIAKSFDSAGFRCFVDERPSLTGAVAGLFGFIAGVGVCLVGRTSTPGSRSSPVARTRRASFPSPMAPFEAIQRWLLKRELRALLDDSDRGTQTSEAQKLEIERLIDALAALNPTEVAATRLTGRWRLLWTTEKETLALAGGGVLGRAVTDVYQLIDTAAGTLSNRIDFQGGAFEVDSSCEPSNGIRVGFSFNAARIRFGDFTLPLPPVGKGWFDCVYLDEELRIVRDSRDDTLIALRK